MPNLQNRKSLNFQEGPLEVRSVEAENVETVETVEEIGRWDKQRGRGLRSSERSETLSIDSTQSRYGLADLWRRLGQESIGLEP